MVDPDPEERSDSSNSRGLPAPRSDEDMYYNPERYVPIVELENHQLRKQLAEATKRNEELARQAAGAQAPPRRPRGRPRGSTTSRRAEQVLPPASQPVHPRPQRSNRAEGTTNPTAKAQTGAGNNRAPSVAQNPNPDVAQNNPEPDRANSEPSRPPSPIRHPPSPIRYPSPV
ncbi:pollen-specific leucine-rich repeat extensin-like protein 2 [Humulus lupulus]|uniref:pollen-specific leucine-rich repeat extensin-like protein 2 n=1 Tax=Humulus lupulus TaxID=3486 RepID=UPI002B405FE9|nr:pollen-specific leucine-rich repeat extensin-like protein 2 [Humulus lupulus]